MTKYYLNANVTDKMLESAGFTVTNGIYGYEFASRKSKDRDLYIALSEKCYSTFGVRYIEFSSRFYDRYSVRPYIMDLIKLGFVTVIKDDK